jgi:type II secretory pathway component GspD/PulD (secretin)
VPPGISGVLAYPLDNSLIVRGDPDAIADLKNVIRLLDIPPIQIQIKVEQVAVTTGYARAFGFDWTVVNNNLAVTSNLPNATGGNIEVAVAGGNFRAQLSALLNSNKATVINSATVTTENNVPAVITTVSVSYVFLPNTSQIAGAGQVTTYTPTALQIPTILTAQPRVNGDGSISMFIPFTISQPSGVSTSPTGTQIPNQITSSIFALRRVPSGGTVVLGGTLQKNDQEADSRIPLLSELPIIGRLFRSRNVNKNQTETLIFFTPTIIPDVPGRAEIRP